jgi:hypothetical protein
MNRKQTLDCNFDNTIKKTAYHVIYNIKGWHWVEFMTYEGRETEVAAKACFVATSEENSK